MNMVACPDWTGRTTPLHCVASGKVLLATMPERDVMRLAKKGLQACTERTITTLEQLLEELARVRRRGIATAFSEWEPGQNGIAAPVQDATAGAITIEKVSGPVGESLVMTAAGLAVAIPAVLAYNVFGKRVAASEAELEGFAHDLREMIVDTSRVA